MQRRLLFGVLGSICILMALAVATPAAAAPIGAATNLKFGSPVCNADGTVSGTLSWTPSGIGSQYVDLAVDSGFNSYSRGGPFATTTSAVSLTQLKRGVTYYARVLTVTSSATLSSDLLAVTASTCSGSTGPITAPTNLTALARTDGSVRFDWSSGANNNWFCVDTARSLSDLYNLSNTWRNHGCWTTNSDLIVTGLQCGQTYYWLVYAWNATSNIKSDAAVFQTASCQSTISAPTGLDATLLNNDNVLFDWNAGQSNNWFCVDTAESRSDLLNLAGTWRNHGCWTTSSQLIVSGLDCDTTYYWLVYAWNNVANVKSDIDSFRTAPCKPGVHLEEAPIEDVDVVKTDGSYTADIVAALPNGCHTPDSHRVQRSGNTIRITVWNKVVEGPCTQVYSEYELHVNLGSNFIDGQTYTVIVNNDESDTFTPPGN